MGTRPRMQNMEAFSERRRHAQGVGSQFCHVNIFLCLSLKIYGFQRKFQIFKKRWALFGERFVMFSMVSDLLVLHVGASFRFLVCLEAAKKTRNAKPFDMESEFRLDLLWGLDW